MCGLQYTVPLEEEEEDQEYLDAILAYLGNGVCMCCGVCFTLVLCVRLTISLHVTDRLRAKDGWKEEAAATGRKLLQDSLYQNEMWTGGRRRGSSTNTMRTTYSATTLASGTTLALVVGAGKDLVNGSKHAKLEQHVGRELTLLLSAFKTSCTELEI